MTTDIGNTTSFTPKAARDELNSGQHGNSLINEHSPLAGPETGRAGERAAAGSVRVGVG
jgi:hypothetical protein